MMSCLYSWLLYIDLSHIDLGIWATKERDNFTKNYQVIDFNSQVSLNCF